MIVGLNFRPSVLVSQWLVGLAHLRTPILTAKDHVKGAADLAHLGLDASLPSSLEISDISSSFLEESDEADPASTPTVLAHCSRRC